MLDKLAFRREPRAGDRAPDARCRIAATDEPTTLFDQFRGPRFTLLLFDGTAHTETGYEHLTSVASRVEELLGEDVEARIIASLNTQPTILEWDGVVLLDPTHEVHKFYGANAESLYLVHPDGYVGFRSQPAIVEPMLDYLSCLFLLDSNHSRHGHQGRERGLRKAPGREQTWQ